MNLYRGKSSREVYLASLLYDSIDDNNFNAVKLLLCEKEADPNLILPIKNISSFHLAVGCDDETFSLKVTKLILQNGGNPNVCSDDGLTPVHIAAAWGRVEILRILLNCGGDGEYRDSNLMTPIHYAIKESWQDCVDLLRSYLPYNYNILNKDQENCCQYRLDKIIVNNGYARGEYGVLLKSENRVDVGETMEDLGRLPKPDTTKYVLNWFETHIDSRGGETFVKNVSDTSEEEKNKRLSYDSSLDESENDKKIVFSKNSNGKKTKIDETNVAMSSGFDSAESDTRNCCKEISGESGILSFTTSTDHLINNFDNINSKNVHFKIFPNFNESISLGNGVKYMTCSKNLESKVSLNYNNLNSIGNVVNGSNENLQCFKNGDTKISANYNNLNSRGNGINGSNEYLTCSTNVDSRIFSDDSNLNPLGNGVNSSVFNKNILAISGDSNLLTSDDSVVNKMDDEESTELSFVTVSEYYKYEDKSEGITLYEKRMVKITSDEGESVKTFSTKMSSLPETFDYDAVTLRRELTLLGYDPPGPITVTTKRLYLKKLYRLQKDAAKKTPQKTVRKSPQLIINRVYSPELEKTLRDPTWKQDLSVYRRLEEVLVKEFSTPLPSRKWREGHSKSSFTYLLLDPRKTDDLPCRAHTMDPQEVWKTFLSAIFYIGKGKKTRPYAHLYEAVNLWRRGGGRNVPKKKLQTILDIWKSNGGVICLHVFQNIIPVEAYTREATMISALKMENLTNEKQGEFYGMASTWQGTQKRLLGTYLLHKALTVFLTEGERQLYAADISTG
ncbi:uncharacterized protein LOC130902523 [Diorhabda carinulata]|uniref:uncharacterized protein LOC130902523 n=1 Tax=Diorhabda carinulata TaxID=1163345 RepID=UPI0025A13E51|nr:uncharacterized protein LOC130902523 [Diorhabda carinulata]